STRRARLPPKAGAGRSRARAPEQVSWNGHPLAGLSLPPAPFRRARLERRHVLRKVDPSLLVLAQSTNAPEGEPPIRARSSSGPFRRASVKSASQHSPSEFWNCTTTGSSAGSGANPTLGPLAKIDSPALLRSPASRFTERTPSD